jgi:hypothetical protein
MELGITAGYCIKPAAGGKAKRVTLMLAEVGGLKGVYE